MTDRQLLQSIGNDIEQITGIKAVFYDGEGQLIHAQPNSMSPFCQEIRRFPSLAKRCLQCDREGRERCRTSGQTEIYQCHMGLTEAVAPILDNGVVIGHILFGQLLLSGARTQVRERVQTLDEPIDRTVLTAALDEMKETPIGTVEASARLMAMCACYARLTTLLSVRQNSLAVHIEQYLSAHLSDRTIGIHTVSRHFGISRGTLYTVSKTAYGMGLSEYLKRLRLRRAVELLGQGQSVTAVAEQVGFADAAYMSKCIKKEYGHTPKKLQKLHLSEK